MPFASASQERSPAIDHQMLRPVQATRPIAAAGGDDAGPVESREGDATARPADDESRRNEHRGRSEGRGRVGAGGATGEERPRDEDGNRGENESDEA